jgi:hypothetical protein
LLPPFIRVGDARAPSESFDSANDGWGAKDSAVETKRRTANVIFVILIGNPVWSNNGNLFSNYVATNEDNNDAIELVIKLLSTCYDASIEESFRVLKNKINHFGQGFRDMNFRFLPVTSAVPVSYIRRLKYVCKVPLGVFSFTVGIQSTVGFFFRF